MDDTPSIQITSILETAVRKKASDIHIHIGVPPTLRVNGEFMPLATKVMTAADVESLFKQIAPERVVANFHDSGQEDFAVNLQGIGGFRVNVCAEFNGKAIIMRALPNVMTMKELNLEPVYYDFIKRDKGLVLVTGATGSGKSTLLAAMVHEINQTQGCHIITVEDPIEFRHDHKKSIIMQREVHTHVKTFPKALEAAMREDPDVILIGEMRDEESVEAALRAAETGHLVFATLHSNTAATTINRVIDFFPEGKQSHARAMLAASLIGIISQTLLPRKDVGRVAAREVLVMHDGIKNLIRLGKIEQIPSQIQIGKGKGMITMEQSIEDLMVGGHISGTTALAKLKEMDLKPSPKLQSLAYGSAAANDGGPKPRAA